MDEIIEKTYYGRIKGVNSSDNMINLLVAIPGENDLNVKTKESSSEFVIGLIYKLKVGTYPNTERNICYLLEYTKVSSLEDSNEIDYAYRLFDTSCPYTKKELEDAISNYISKIENDKLQKMTKKLIDNNYELFYIYPAAQRFHHNYVGGLAYHTFGMLKLADKMLETYEYLDKNYLYAGVILHDIGKVYEFSGVENTEYTLKGQLLGHLVMGGFEVSKVARELGCEDSEEALLLEHMIISHHGQQMFGACKKPQTPEAMMLWYIDTLDSKFRVLGEVLDKTKPGTFTDVIGVMDKTKIYKKN